MTPEDQADYCMELLIKLELFMERRFSRLVLEKCMKEWSGDGLHPEDSIKNIMDHYGDIALDIIQNNGHIPLPVKYIMVRNEVVKQLLHVFYYINRKSKIINTHALRATCDIFNECLHGFQREVDRELKLKIQQQKAHLN